MVCLAVWMSYAGRTLIDKLFALILPIGMFVASGFEHKLLLGHVSMLTDIALVVLNGRNYIITADRDEHIRISRGIPQSHIIEGFCLGLS